jgi:hypothetical protein
VPLSAIRYKNNALNLKCVGGKRSEEEEEREEEEEGEKEENHEKKRQTKRAMFKLTVRFAA